MPSITLRFTHEITIDSKDHAFLERLSEEERASMWAYLLSKNEAVVSVPCPNLDLVEELEDAMLNDLVEDKAIEEEESDEEEGVKKKLIKMAAPPSSTPCFENAKWIDNITAELKKGEHWEWQGTGFKYYKAGNDEHVQDYIIVCDPIAYDAIRKLLPDDDVSYSLYKFVLFSDPTAIEEFAKTYVSPVRCDECKTPNLEKWCQWDGGIYCERCYAITVLGVNPRQYDEEEANENKTAEDGAY